MRRDDARLADAAAGGRGLQPEVAAFGEWDTSNLGDRGIHEGVLRFFGECGWRVGSYAIGSLTPVSADAAGGGSTPAVRGRIGAALGIAPGLKRALRRIRQRVRMNALLPRLRPAQAIMVGGGELLSDRGLHFPQSLAVIGEASRRLDKPLLCLGCGAEGPWSARGAEMIRKFLAGCSLVAARDRDSAERIAALLGRPVPVFGDFCLSEGLLRRGAWSRRRQAVAINVQRIPEPWSAAQDRYEDALVALASRLMHLAVWHGLKTVRIFTTGPAEDALPAQRVFERLGGNGIELHVPASLEQLSGMLRECALVVASRLHAGILGLAEGAPAVGFCPQPKLRKFFSTVGIGDYSFDLNAGARLIHRLEEAGCAAILAEQRDRVMHAPIWADRTRVRRELGSIAERAARCG